MPGNILVFLCDQLRPDFLRLYGCEAVPTPNLDRLAGEGVVFDHAITASVNHDVQILAEYLPPPGRERLRRKAPRLDPLSESRPVEAPHAAALRAAGLSPDYTKPKGP